jgi:hypothetical protein
MFCEVPAGGLLAGSPSCKKGGCVTYSEKLKDPRWQRKRLEVLQAADFKCWDCGESTQTLHVHHCYYEKGLMPWEYPDEALKCLCEYCHAIRQEVELMIQKDLASLNYDELHKFKQEIMTSVLVVGVDPVANELDKAFWADVPKS